ncbi:MAG: rod shape-determining protein MreD [Deltaproteobacteria bacterium]|nr:rod shape-determining protein MreD [Deltaproteobacteria bacterium]
MKDYITYIPVALVFLSIKTTIAPSIPLPDVVLLSVFYTAYNRPSASGAFLAFCLGYIEDTFYGNVIGSTSFAFAVLYGVTYLIRLKLRFESTPVKAAASAVAALSKGICTLLVLNSIGIQATSFLLHTVPVAAFTGILAPFIFNLFDRLPAPKLYGHTNKDSI